MPDSISALPLNEFGLNRAREQPRDRQGDEATGPEAGSVWFQEEVAPHEAALRAWLRRNHPVLREHVDDVIQETYLRLLRAREGGQIRSTKSFLFGIARNISLNLHRLQRGRSFVSVNEAGPGGEIATEEDVVATVIRRQELLVTEAVIADLPERCRQVAKLHVMEGLSYREIAGRLGLAEQTVRVQMTRAVRKCVSHLRAQNLRERKSQ